MLPKPNVKYHQIPSNTNVTCAVVAICMFLCMPRSNDVGVAFPWPRALAMIRVIERLFLLLFCFCILCGLRTFYCLWLARLCVRVWLFWFGHPWQCDFNILEHSILATPLSLRCWQHPWPFDFGSIMFDHRPLHMDRGCSFEHLILQAVKTVFWKRAWITRVDRTHTCIWHSSFDFSGIIQDSTLATS